MTLWGRLGRTKGLQTAPFFVSTSLRRPSGRPRTPFTTATLQTQNPANGQSRRPDSNRGPLHYEGKTSRGRASTRGHAWARSRCTLADFMAPTMDARARPYPGSRTRFVPVPSHRPNGNSRRPILPGPPSVRCLTFPVRHRRGYRCGVKVARNPCSSRGGSTSFRPRASTPGRLTSRAELTACRPER
jgi:hypothetical protein